MSERDYVRNAIEVVKAHLAKEWIEDGCEGDEAFGCSSCQAIRLRGDLDALLHSLDDPYAAALSPAQPVEEK